MINLNRGFLSGLGLNNFYWSKSAAYYYTNTGGSSSATAYYFYTDESILDPSNDPSRRCNGYPVRCLASGT